jgi:hypothetical protein
MIIVHKLFRQTQHLTLLLFSKARTDDKINKLVYTLYNLTEEEIKIVESA